jgi:DNA segregation ATPase FtsK/SpoIIIE, S-DNA-T family
MERCDGCGYVYGSCGLEDTVSLLPKLTGEYARLLRGGTVDAIRARPSPTFWSPVEYTCHVRDVFLVQRDRIIRALMEDNPALTTMYRDQRVTLAGYGAEETDELLVELDVATRLLTRVLARLTAEQLARPCTYHYPSPTRRDVAWVCAHTLHESVHHLDDVRTGLGLAALGAEDLIRRSRPAESDPGRDPGRPPSVR